MEDDDVKKRLDLFTTVANGIGRKQLIMFVTKMFGDFMRDPTDDHWRDCQMAAGLLMAHDKDEKSDDQEIVLANMSSKSEIPPKDIPVCPYCLVGNDAFAELKKSKIPHGPKPNDFSVCTTCLEISKFDDDMNLIKITPGEAYDLDENNHDEIEGLRSKMRQVQLKWSESGMTERMSAVAFIHLNKEKRHKDND